MSFSASEDEDLEPVIILRQRSYRPMINTVVTEVEFKQRFRITHGDAEMLLGKIGSHLQHPTRRGHAMAPHDQLLIALRFLATGAFYRVVGDAQGPSESTICRNVRRVVTAINSILFDKAIRWPNSNNDIALIPLKFREIGGMPCVCGCVDGTLITIKAPSVAEDQYVDRHGNHSINCMVVAGPNMKAYYVSAKWPGRLNDKRVIKNSALHNAFEAGWRPFPNAVILGDSGYALREWLLPPIGGVNLSVEEALFNSYNRSTRRTVECYFGILKQKFACLSIPLRVEPLYACEIFKCCTVLQNFSTVSDDLYDLDENVNEPQVNNDDAIVDGPHLLPNDPRRRIISIIQ
jgi:hypothetical protein